MIVCSPNRNGQIVIPADMRRAMGINESSLFVIEMKGGTIELTPVKTINKRRVMGVNEKGKKKA